MRAVKHDVLNGKIVKTGTTEKRHVSWRGKDGWMEWVEELRD